MLDQRRITQAEYDAAIVQHVTLVNGNGPAPPNVTAIYPVQKILGTGSYSGTRSVRPIIYRYTESDGTVTYSNVPRGAAAPSFR